MQKTPRELVAECLERLEEGGLEAVETYLERHPEHADGIRERLRVLMEAGLLDAPGDAGFAFPERLGTFRLIERLGGGGMGVVYLAEQEPLGRRVALKLVRPDLLYFERARERFQREIEVVARLKHPGIVPVYTVGEEEGIPFYAMEYVEGRSLDELLRSLRGRDPGELRGRDLLEAVGGADEDVTLENGRPLASASWVDACFHLVLQLCTALEHAHARGVLHRDLKPSNVMLAPGARVLLLDFGLASTRGTSRLTRTGSQVGSLPYMAPEQLRGREVDERTDLYAVGATLYELLTLRLPYFSRDPEETRRRILAGVPRPPREENAAVPWDAETVCLTAMERDAARRYASARALADDLRAVLRRRPITARRPGPVLRARRFVQRHPAASVAGLLGGVLFVGSLVFGLVQRRTSLALERAVTEKDAALVEARAGFRRALEATNEMLREVGSSELKDVPAADRLRRDLLADAVRLYTELLEEHPDDPELRREAAVGFQSQARVLRELGDLDQAVGATQRSLALLDGLRAEHPLDPAVLKSLGDSFAELSVDLALNGETARAIEVNRLTMQVRRELVSTLESRGADAGNVRVAEQAVAEALGGLGTGRAIQRRFAEAEEALVEACAILDQVLVEDPASVNGRRRLVLYTDNLAGVYQQTGRLAEAQATQERARAIAEALVEETPESTTDRDTLARVLFNLAGILERRGMLDEAVAVGEQSLERYEGLLRDHPDLVVPAAHRIRILNRLGSIAMDRGELDAAEARFEEALRLADALVADHPSFQLGREAFVDAVTNSGDHRRRAGRLDEAEELLRWALDEVDRLCADWPDSCAQGTFRSRAATPLARTLLALGRLDEARAAAQEIRDFTRARRDGTPDREEPYAETLVVCAEVAAARDDLAALEETCRELASAKARSADLRQAAGLLLSAAAPAGGPPRVVADLALDLLEHARASGNGAAPDELAAAADLRALRGLPRFRRLTEPLALARGAEGGAAGR